MQEKWQRYPVSIFLQHTRLNFYKDTCYRTTIFNQPQKTNTKNLTQDWRTNQSCKTQTRFRNRRWSSVADQDFLLEPTRPNMDQTQKIHIVGQEPFHAHECEKTPMYYTYRKSFCRSRRQFICSLSFIDDTKNRNDDKSWISIEERRKPC